MNALMRVFIAVTFSLVTADAIAQRASIAAVPPIPAEHRNNRWYRQPQSDVVIVFVHGIFSDSHGCWTSEKNGAYWPEIIKNDPVFGKAGIFLAGYTTAVRHKNSGMNEAAKEVFDALKANGVLDSSNIIFVCHSTGGIVTRYMLTDRWEVFRTKNIGLALYASPTKGSRIASLVGSVAKAMGQKLGFQLRWRSELLDDLHDRFREKVGESLNINLVGMELCETVGVLAKIVVTCESAGAYFGAEKLAGRNHFETVKPVSQSDEPNIRLENFFSKRFVELMKRSDSTTPVLSCISPSQATAVGSFPILVTGDSFRAGLQARLDDVPLTIEKLTPTGVVAKVPPNITAGKHRVFVKNPNSQEAFRGIIIDPVITSVTPVAVSVRGGEKLTIRGQGFVAPVTVRVCGYALDNVQVISKQEIVGTVAPRFMSERCDVAVELDDVTSYISQAVRYDPALSAVTPTTAPVDQVLTAGVAGTGFQPSATVTIGGMPVGVQFDSSSMLTIKVPARATTGPVDVVLTHADGSTTTLARGFTYTPSVTGALPANGPLGGANVVTLTGSGFDRTTKVSFGDVTLAATIVDSHTLSVTVPSQSTAGTVDVNVRNADGTSATLGQAYTYDSLVQNPTVVQPPGNVP